jgi:hypothetical protein
MAMRLAPATPDARTELVYETAYAMEVLLYGASLALAVWLLYS